MGASEDATELLIVIYDAQLKQEAVDENPSGRPANFNTKSIAEIIGWPALRMNTAVDLLETAGFLVTRTAMGTRPFKTFGVELTARGRLQCEKLSPGIDETRKDAVTVTKIFISHSSEDRSIAKALIEFLEAALVTEAGTILCTSVPGYTLEGGDDAPSALRRHLAKTSAVLAILSPASLRSSYVLMELGAAWALEKRAIPLLVPHVGFADLPKPFGDIHALEIIDAAQITSLISTLSKCAGLTQSGNHPKVQAALVELTNKVIQMGLDPIAKKDAVQRNDSAPEKKKSS